ncbi:hypothetical protein [Methanobrevibacter sp.]|uniref:hypothetical protein n=1 Tax=Methanobrevibacter sp. TaxID=66852 RepID=UPI0038902B01
METIIPIYSTNHTPLKKGEIIYTTSACFKFDNRTSHFNTEVKLVGEANCKHMETYKDPSPSGNTNYTYDKWEILEVI